MRPDALIFDVDGTLAETEELHRRAFNEAFGEYGLDWQWSRDDYRRLLQTTGGKERIARHMKEIGLDVQSVDILALHRAKTNRYAALMGQGGLTLCDGVRDLVDAARNAGLRVAVATTTSRPNVDALCEATFGAPASEVFSVIACGDEVTAKKPAPDVYLLALRRLCLDPRQTVAFEDSRNGLQSAIAAEINCIVTPSAYTKDEDFSGALCVLQSLKDLGGLDGLSRLQNVG